MSYQTTPFVKIDTREQRPYSFPDGWPVMKATLKTGDMTLLGHEDVFVIERKSLNDLVGCIFTDRFRRELERLREYKHAFLAIEASIYKIENMLEKICPQSKAKPASVIGFLQSVPLLYGVHVLFLDDRKTAEKYVAGLLEKYNRFLLNDRKENI